MRSCRFVAIERRQGALNQERHWYGENNAGDAEHNAKALLSVLKGQRGPYRDVALLNAAAALVIAGKAADLKGGIGLAARSIDSGEAEGALERLIVVSSA